MLEPALRANAESIKIFPFARGALQQVLLQEPVSRAIPPVAVAASLIYGANRIYND